MASRDNTIDIAFAVFSFLTIVLLIVFIPIGIIALPLLILNEYRPAKQASCTNYGIVRDFDYYAVHAIGTKNSTILRLQVIFDNDDIVGNGFYESKEGKIVIKGATPVRGKQFCKSLKAENLNVNCFTARKENVENYFCN